MALSLWTRLDSQLAAKAHLERALGSGRLPQVMIFSGPAGSGKRAVALALSQNLLCENPQANLACGQCGSCLRVEKQAHESLLIIEPDKGQIKVEQSRIVREWAGLEKISRARVAIFDPADWINVQAANSLLKLLEEPPPHTYFLLLSSMPAALPSTIRSRSQMVRFFGDSISHVDAAIPDDLRDLLDRWLEASAKGVASSESVALKDILSDRDHQISAVRYLLSESSKAFRGEKSRLNEFRSGLVDLAAEFSNLEAELNRGFDRTLIFESLSAKLYHSKDLRA